MVSLTSRSVAAVAVALAVPNAAGLATPPARTHVVVSNLDAPVCVAAAPGDLNHVFVCEKPGRIQVANTSTDQKNPAPFLDIHTLVNTAQDNGLLGLAFDPAYQTNGFFYVEYNSTDSNAVLARYHATPGTYVADAGSAYTILRYPRPAVGHCGGWIGFSPLNGLLYISTGDGDTGAFADPLNRAQTLDNQFLGKILRIDPHGDDFPADPDRNYHVPAANPFVGVAGDDEIWSYGVRNPWRCSFDRTTGDFYFGDVGQNSYEEIDREPASSTGGRNYGWRCMEAGQCTGAGGCQCVDPSFIPPLHGYDHTVGGSAIGGYVYRGAAIPAYQGLYIFADFSFNKIWTFRPVGNGGPGGIGTLEEFTDRSMELRPTTVSQPIPVVSCFGEDPSGEVYVCSIAGVLYKIVPYPCVPVVDVQPAGVNALSGQLVVLSVVGAGADPLTFRWRKDGVPMNDGPGVSGAFTPTLTITSAQPVNAGNYSVLLSCPCGSTPSATVLVAVNTNCRPDFNGTGGLTPQDIFDFMAAWFLKSPGADFNQVGGISIQDIFDFLAAWFAGCSQGVAR